MLYLILFLMVAVCVYFPQIWVRWIMRKHHKPISDMPGTGGELAKHLLSTLDITDVVVEMGAERQDHFDSQNKAVRLSTSNFNGKSITALAVAAHEVGHAIQCHRQELIFRLRSRFVPIAIRLQQFGQILILAAPFVSLVFRAPSVFVGLLVASLVAQLLGALVYLIVLPEEWDASFNKALPLLVQGEYLPAHLEPAARQVLRAAALTYFAGALASILNIGRWAVLLRRP